MTLAIGVPKSQGVSRCSNVKLKLTQHKSDVRFCACIIHLDEERTISNLLFSVDWDCREKPVSPGKDQSVMDTVFRHDQ